MIMSSFPYHTIDPIIGLPTYQKKQELHAKLNANAASIYTNLCNGSHGLLRLTVSGAQCNSVSLVSFLVLANPSAISTYSLNTIAAKQAKETEVHDMTIKVFREYSLADNTLTQLLLVTVEEKYYRVIRNSLIGYANITTRALIQHLYTNYTDITSTQLSNNDAQMRYPYDPNQHIESLYE